MTGETVTLFISDSGLIEPTHLILDIWEPADLNQVLNGSYPTVNGTTNDQFSVAYMGTDTDGLYDASLAVRLSQPWLSTLRNAPFRLCKRLPVLGILATRHSLAKSELLGS